MTAVVWLTPTEVARALRVSKMSVYRLLEAGEIAHLRVGRNYRIAPEDLNAYVNRHTRGAVLRPVRRSTA